MKWKQQELRYGEGLGNDSNSGIEAVCVQRPCAWDGRLSPHGSEQGRQATEGHRCQARDSSFCLQGNRKPLGA